MTQTEFSRKYKLSPSDVFKAVYKAQIMPEDSRNRYEYDEAKMAGAVLSFLKDRVDNYEKKLTDARREYVFAYEQLTEA